MGESQNLLEARHLYKTFHGGEVKALDGAGIRLAAGEVHGLLGENGSGKTTLVRCLAGQLSPDSGEITVNGSAPDNDGIVLIPQHPQLIPSLSLFNYLRLGDPHNGADLENRVNELCGDIGIDLPLHTQAFRLPANQVTLGVIIGGLLGNPRFLIMDEPTTSFTPAETDRLFGFLSRLAAAGTGVLLVSHKIRELYNRVDRITMLRRGRLAAESSPDKYSLEEISRLLMGEGTQVIMENPAGKNAPGKVCLSLDHVSRQSRETWLTDVSLELKQGEILAVTGIRENGLDCLERILTAAENPSGGSIRLKDGKPYPQKPELLRKAGIVIVPSDRQQSGAALDLTVGDNGAAVSRKELSRNGLLTRGKRDAYTARLLEQYNLATEPEVSAATLSGGMLQRLILARELESGGNPLILCEPAWGLDLRSRAAVYRRIVELRNQGRGILLLASDMDEVLDVADRLLVLYDGRINASFPRSEFNHQEIGEAVLGLRENLQ